MISRSFTRLFARGYSNSTKFTPPKRVNSFTSFFEKSSIPESRSLRERWLNRTDGEAIPITWRTLAVTFGCAAGGLYYLDYEKSRTAAERKEREAKLQRAQYGKPDVGGPFKLIDADTGKVVTEKDYAGKFMVMYFGFTHCPDVCPDELEKMSVAISKLDKLGVGNMVVPIFVSVDPGRDTPEVVKKYIKEFHPRFVGLTGDDEEVKKIAKLFRIYISKSDVDKDGDYLVDHSIFFFLMDPENGFKDYYGRNATADDIVSGIRKHVEQWKMDHK